MTDMQKAAALLRQAASNIETALLALDTRERDCKECGTRHWRNRTQAKIYQQFTGAPHNLRTAADRLEQQAAEATDGNHQAAQSAKEQ